MRLVNRLMLLAAVSVALLAQKNTQAAPVSYVWNKTTSSTWATTGNWTSSGGTYPDEIGDSAALRQNITSNVTVTIGTGITAIIGGSGSMYTTAGLWLEDTTASNNWIIAAAGTGKLVADAVGTAYVTMITRTGTNTISAPIQMLDNLMSSVTNAGTSLTISGNISGAKTFVQSGAGTTILSGTNSYTGSTSVKQGVLQFNSTASVPTTGKVLDDDGGTVAFGGSFGTIQDTLNTKFSTVGYAGVIAVNYGHGSEDIDFSAATGANLALTLGAINGDVTYSGTLTPNETYGYLLGGGGGTITVSSNLTSANSALTINRANTNVGNVTLSGTNSFTGNTTITAGTLKLSNQYALGGSTLAGGAGTLVFDSGVSGHAFTFGGLSGSKDLALADNASNAVALSVGDNDATTIYSGVLSGDSLSSLTKIGNGSLTLSNVNTYAGDTNISAGSLTLGVGGSIDDSAKINVGASGVFDVSAVSGYSLAGGQTLEGNGTIHGAVTISSDATLGPGNSIGTLTFDDALTLAMNSTTEMDIAKSGSLLTSDLVQVATTLTLTGTLNVLADGDTLAMGDTWNLFDATTITGEFDAYVLPEFLEGSNLAWDTSKLAVDGTLSVASVPEPGTLALLAAGLLGLLAYAWRKRK